MKLFVPLIVALMLAGCVTTPIPYTTSRGKQDCLVKAIGFKDALKADQTLSAHRWAEVIAVNWSTHLTGHAICVYEYNGRIMVYDNQRGSWPITKDMTLKNDALALAKLWWPQSGIAYAEFMYEN